MELPQSVTMEIGEMPKEIEQIKQEIVKDMPALLDAIKEAPGGAVVALDERIKAVPAAQEQNLRILPLEDFDSSMKETLFLPADYGGSAATRTYEGIIKGYGRIAFTLILILIGIFVSDVPYIFF